jgi:hypothetical protein
MTRASAARRLLWSRPAFWPQIRMTPNRGSFRSAAKRSTFWPTSRAIWARPHPPAAQPADRDDRPRAPDGAGRRLGEAHRASHWRRLAGDVRVPRRRLVAGRAAEREAQAGRRRPRVTIHRIVRVDMAPPYGPIRRCCAVQISPSPSKPSQTNPNKIAWICLVLFVRIGTYQWVTADSK